MDVSFNRHARWGVALLSALVLFALPLRAMGDPLPRPPVVTPSPASQAASQAYRAGRYAQAITIAERGLAGISPARGAARPASFPLLLVLTNALRASGQFARAEETADRAAELATRLWGPDDTQTARALVAQGEVLRWRGDYTRATSVLERALRIHERNSGPNSLDAAEALVRLGGVYGELGRFEQTLELQERALRIREATLPPDSIEIAESLAEVAWACRFLARFDRAVAEDERAIHIWERAFGPGHPDSGLAWMNMAMAAHARGQYDVALRQSERAVQILEHALGSEHHKVSYALSAIAIALGASGHPRDALPILERAARIRERALGPEHHHTAVGLSNLGMGLRDVGDPVHALPLLERAVGIWRRIFGDEHPLAAVGKNNLAAVCMDLGQYERALSLFEQVEGTWTRTLGPRHPNLAFCVNNQALTRTQMGDHARALILLRRARDLFVANFGERHPHVALCDNNSAYVYVQIGQYARGRELLEQAVHEWEGALRPDAPEIALALTGLGTLLVVDGSPDVGAARCDRARRILETAVGGQHPQVAQTHLCLALADTERARFDDAAQHYERALEIHSATLGTHHPDRAPILEGLAEVERARGNFQIAKERYAEARAIHEATHGELDARAAVNYFGSAALAIAGGDRDEATRLYTHALRATADAIGSIANYQREGAISQYIDTISAIDDLPIHMALRWPDNESLRRLALSAVLVTKGRAEHEAASMLEGMRRAAASNPDELALIDRWAQTRRRRAALLARGPSGVDVDAFARERIAFDQEVIRLEDELARRNARWSDRRTETQPDGIVARVAARVPDDAALIEIVSYRPYLATVARSRARWGTPRYAAFVLRHDEHIALVDLGETARINSLAQALFNAVATPGPDADLSSIRRASEALSSALFAPLRPVLDAGVRELVLAPDGPLHVVPLHLMQQGAGYLADQYLVSYVTSGRDLLRVREARVAPEAPVTVIAPSYPVAEWQLPGVSGQVAILSRRFPGLSVFRDGDATEQRLLDLHAPRLLHIGAHGTFVSATERGDELPPMIRGRLLLAEVRPDLSFSPNGADGQATASEIASMNLRGTRLVVLSACDTAQGEAFAGTGVFGMRRAFLLAGAEALVTSLWNVDDSLAVVFVDALYTRLLAGDRYASALAAASLAVRRRDPHPFAWAPFIVVGRNAPLFDEGEPQTEHAASP